MKASDSRAARRRPQFRAVVRVKTIEHPPQRVPTDLAAKPELAGRGANPSTACLARTDVVVLDPSADALHHVDPRLSLVEVVLGLSGRELADRKHEILAP